MSTDLPKPESNGKCSRDCPNFYYEEMSGWPSAQKCYAWDEKLDGPEPYYLTYNICRPALRLVTVKEKVVAPIKIIGLCGYAGAGKDYTATELKKLFDSNNIVCEILPLAKSLKDDLKPFIYQKFKIDITNCTREEKNLLRPILVAYAGVLRTHTEGRFFTGKVQEYIDSPNDLEYIIIPDIRYDEYLYDEYSWLKKHNGLLVAIESKVEPPNEDERINYPKLLAKADLIVNPPIWDNTNEEDKTNYYTELYQKITNLL